MSKLILYFYFEPDFVFLFLGGGVMIICLLLRSRLVSNILFVLMCYTKRLRGKRCREFFESL